MTEISHQQQEMVQVVEQIYSTYQDIKYGNHFSY